MPLAGTQLTDDRRPLTHRRWAGRSFATEKRGGTVRRAADSPQFTARIQLFADCCSPLTSVRGNALQHGGGTKKHGFCVCWLCTSMR